MTNKGSAEQAGGTSLRERAVRAWAEYRAQKELHEKRAGIEAQGEWMNRAARMAVQYGLAPDALLVPDVHEIHAEGLRFHVSWDGRLSLVGPKCPKCEEEPTSDAISSVTMLRELGEAIEETSRGQPFRHQCFPKPEPALQRVADKAELMQMVREKISLIDTYVKDGALETALDRMEELVGVFRTRRRVTDAEGTLVEAIRALIDERLPGR